MNIISKYNIDYEKFVEDLLWNNIVYRKNEDSGYGKVIADGFEDHGLPKGSISKGLKFQAVMVPHRPLTWKELAIELGYFHDILIPDGHDCSICGKRDECKAFFKNDTDHETCNGFIREATPEDEVLEDLAQEEKGEYVDEVPWPEN